jgi:hypothetical protein
LLYPRSPSTKVRQKTHNVEDELREQLSGNMNVAMGDELGQMKEVVDVFNTITDRCFQDCGTGHELAIVASL